MCKTMTFFVVTVIIWNDIACFILQANVNYVSYFDEQLHELQIERTSKIYIQNKCKAISVS